MSKNIFSKGARRGKISLTQGYDISGLLILQQNPYTLTISASLNSVSYFKNINNNKKEEEGIKLGGGHREDRKKYPGGVRIRK